MKEISAIFRMHAAVCHFAILGNIVQMYITAHDRRICQKGSGKKDLVNARFFFYQANKISGMILAVYAFTMIIILMSIQSMLL